MISNLSAARLENIDFDSVEEPSVEEILQYLEWLMRWYCREPSKLLATIIVSRLEWLHELQACGEIALPEWSCSRLIRNWKYLAEHRRRR
ncbi:MAG TPA: hypothetical protein VKB27_03555 [Gammaproteobacteria bacterium]|nr:hypothetical protein [Gammaproteobacteria bacterium]